MKHKQKMMNVFKIAVLLIILIFPLITYSMEEAPLDLILAISCDAWNISKSSSKNESPPHSPKEARTPPESTETQDMQEKEAQVPIATKNKKNNCCLS